MLSSSCDPWSARTVGASYKCSLCDVSVAYAHSRVNLQLTKALVSLGEFCSAGSRFSMHIVAEYSFPCCRTVVISTRCVWS